MIIAVDTGGTKTLVARFSANGEIETSEKFPTPKDQNEYLSQLAVSLKSIIGDTDPNEATIVVAMPGVVKNGVAIWCGNLSWKNFDIRTPLEQALPGARIFVDNDANLGGLGEVRRLEDIPRCALYVTVSTGIGTGVIEYGKIDEGLSFSEGGHSLVEFQGEVRKWESFAAGSAIKNHYGVYARDITDPAVWDDVADRISRGFLAIIPFIQPDKIIIGGSMGTFYSSYGPKLESILADRLPDHIPVPEFGAAQSPEEAVAYGCYYYAIDIAATV